jgi:lycopene cyclase domain-containing protein
MSYGAFNLLFVLVVTVVAALALARVTRERRARVLTAMAVTVVALSVLTVVFDSLMIAADLFRYDEDALSGVVLWLTPVEDLAWPVAVGLGLPAVAEALGLRPRAPQDVR